MRKLRVLVVDDSRFMVGVITTLLEKRGDLEVVGYALDGQAAIEQARALLPDVITMDVVMPRVDGIQATRVITRELAIPIVVLSAYTERGAILTLDALQAGALECLAKPSGERSMNLDSIADELVAKVRRAYAVRNQGNNRDSAENEAPLRRTGQYRLSALGQGEGKPPLVVVIGASTGGVQALGELLPRFTASIPYSIIVVQHFPGGLTQQLARRLDAACSIPVREAESGMRLNRAWIYIAPGGHNVEVTSGLRLRLVDDEGPSIMRPSINAAFESAVGIFGERTVGVILTGMGDDGTRGAASIRRGGGMVLVQSPDTATAKGMPRSAVQAGVADIVLPLNRLGAQLIELAGTRP